MNSTAYDLRIELKVAARAAYLDGATEKQIDMIVALARGANDFNILSGGRLTKTEASRIIDDMVAHDVEPDWNVSTDELDAMAQAEREVKDQEAFRARRKAQKKIEKAEREAERASDIAATAATLSTESGNRVRHVKFGAGTIIERGAAIHLVLFDGEKKPKRMGADFLTAL